MSNPLSVRRVKVQTINEKGEPEGEPTYGVMAADDNAQAYNDTFMTLEELNQSIEEAGCILDIVNGDDFFEADREKIGTDNFYGKDWTTNSSDDDDDDEKQVDIRYVCPTCNHKWEEEYSCACDSECGECGTGNITPLMDKDQDAEWTPEQEAEWEKVGSSES